MQQQKMCKEKKIAIQSLGNFQWTKNKVQKIVRLWLMSNCKIDATKLGLTCKNYSKHTDGNYRIVWNIADEKRLKVVSVRLRFASGQACS